MAITFKNLTKSNLSFLFSKLIPSLKISEDRNFSTRKGKFESGWGRGRKEQLHGIIIASILSTRHILSIHAGRPLHRRACVATRIFISLSPFSSPISFQCTPLIYRRALELYVPPAFTEPPPPSSAPFVSTAPDFDTAGLTRRDCPRDNAREEGRAPPLTPCSGPRRCETRGTRRVCKNVVA